MTHPSIAEMLEREPWRGLEEHLDGLKERIDSSVRSAHELRKRYRQELLEENRELVEQIRRPSKEALDRACQLLQRGSVAASDGTVSPVPLLSGAKIQVGVVIVFNTGQAVERVTRIWEHDLASDATSGREFFSNLRQARTISNLISRAIMLFGERRLLLDHAADWRMVHGELIPHELRTGAGRPSLNLPPTFDLINRYIESQSFIAVSESPQDLDVLNAAILLEPGEYIQIRSLTDDLEVFLNGDEETGRAAANFASPDRDRFRQFIRHAGPQVAIVLAKAGQTPYILECHIDRVEEAIALFMTDSLWLRGLPLDGSAIAIRGFPFHLDLADQVARTLFKGSEFRDFVEARLMSLGVEEGLFDLEPRRTRA